MNTKEAATLRRGVGVVLRRAMVAGLFAGRPARQTSGIAAAVGGPGESKLAAVFGANSAPAINPQNVKTVEFL